MRNWIAFYVRDLSQSNQLLQELHGWECHGKDRKEALENLEQNPYVPFACFLGDIVLVEEAEAWIAEFKAEAKKLKVPFIYRLHKYNG